MAAPFGAQGTLENAYLAYDNGSEANVRQEGAPVDALHLCHFSLL